MKAALYKNVFKFLVKRSAETVARRLKPLLALNPVNSKTRSIISVSVSVRLLWHVLPQCLICCQFELTLRSRQIVRIPFHLYSAFSSFHVVALDCRHSVSNQAALILTRTERTVHTAHNRSRRPYYLPLARYMYNSTLTQFKAIRGRRHWCQSKAHVQFPISSTCSSNFSCSFRDINA